LPKQALFKKSVFQPLPKQALFKKSIFQALPKWALFKKAICRTLPKWALFKNHFLGLYLYRHGLKKVYFQCNLYVP